MNSAWDPDVRTGVLAGAGTGACLGLLSSVVLRCLDFIASSNVVPEWLALIVFVISAVAVGTVVAFHPSRYEAYEKDQMRSARRRWRARISVALTLTASVTAVVILLLPGEAKLRFSIPFPGYDTPWLYNGEFHSQIAEADQIVVRDGGYNCCRTIRRQRVLLRITDPSEIKRVSDNLVFLPEQMPGQCACCGYPGIDWYKGRTRLALTAIQHGVAVRWKGFPGDSELTTTSAQWLMQWLLDNKIPDHHSEFAERLASFKKTPTTNSTVASEAPASDRQ
jgi:hypothetical protein